MSKPSFMGALGERLQIPGEALGEMKLSVLANHRALIENHRGLLHCTEDLLAVRGERVNLRIFGQALRIEAMDGCDLLVSGRLERAEWEE